MEIGLFKEIEMKRKILIGSIVLILVTITILFIPNKIEKSIDGVFYKMGIENTQGNYKNINISISGNYRRGFPYHHSFRGTIAISDLYLNDSVDIVFDKSNKAYLTKTQYNSILNRVETKTFGIIFIDKGFKNLSINVLSEESGGWNSESGTIISAPAKTKDEAIVISEKLLKYKLGE